MRRKNSENGEKTMETFCIRLADRVIGLQTVYPDTRILSRDYLCGEPPELSFETREADIEYERTMSRREQPGIEYPGGYLETLAVYRKISEALLGDGCILMHGAVVSVDGEAYLFTARSGTGKTTHIRLWQERFGDRCTVVNGDKPILRLKNGTVTAYGTPWCGKEGLNSNLAVPLRSICRLERGTENSIREIGFREALPTLLGQSYIPRTENANRTVLHFWTEAAGTLSFYQLNCNMDPEAADVAYSGMKK